MVYTTQNVSKSSKKIRQITKIRQAQGGLTVYNGGEEPAKMPVEGQYYTFPPDGTWMGPNDDEPRLYNGLSVVNDVYGVDKELVVETRKKNKGGIEKYKHLPKDTIIISAVTIAERAERKLGGRGIVVLTGDPKADAGLKKTAKDAWIKYRVGRAETTLKNYRDKTAGFYKDPRNLGHNPPGMSEFETNEQIFLDQYRSGEIDGRKYPCTYKCGFQHDSAEVMARHVRASHPASREDARSAAMLTEMGAGGATDLSDASTTEIPQTTRGRKAGRQTPAAPPSVDEGLSEAAPAIGAVT